MNNSIKKHDFLAEINSKLYRIYLSMAKEIRGFSVWFFIFEKRSRKYLSVNFYFGYAATADGI